MVSSVDTDFCSNTDLSFDNAEYIYDSNDSGDIADMALPTMQTNFQVR